MKFLIYDPLLVYPTYMKKNTECLFLYEEDEEKTLYRSYYATMLGDTPALSVYFTNFTMNIKNTFPIYVSINPKNNYKDKDISIIREKINENFSKLYDKIKDNQYEYIGLPLQGFEIKSSPLVTSYFKQKIDELKQRLEKEEEDKRLKEEVISWNIS